MFNPEIGLKRLEKLAAHLESGKLGHIKFDFGILHETYNDGMPLPKNKCGALGCALGEVPTCFPRDWKFSEYDNLQNRHDKNINVSDYFDITGQEENHLFSPNSQRPELFGGNLLDIKATAKQVATNIRTFVKQKRLKNELAKLGVEIDN